MIATLAWPPIGADTGKGLGGGVIVRVGAVTSGRKVIIAEAVANCPSPYSTFAVTHTGSSIAETGRLPEQDQGNKPLALGSPLIMAINSGSLPIRTFTSSGGKFPIVHGIVTLAIPVSVTGIRISRLRMAAPSGGDVIVTVTSGVLSETASEDGLSETAVVISIALRVMCVCMIYSPYTNQIIVTNCITSRMSGSTSHQARRIQGQLYQSGVQQCTC
ncbi:MAG: hypothetical protein L0332_15720 [Chloroflexi bacterium]|nr:hypothetical protein [Chloroflexota bacterium]MCI0728149.1 hypothetical protein [Chloroflexota bacterium]